MKILFPIGTFYPAQTGGPDNSVYWITKALKRNKEQPVVIATNKGLKSDVPTEKWLDMDYAKVKYTINRIHIIPFSLIKEACHQLKSTDILHLTMIFYPVSFILATINLLFFGKPTVWSIRGDLDPHMLKRSTWKKRPIILFIKLFLKKKIIFHSTCDAETTYVKKVLGSNIKVAQITNYMELPPRITTVKKKYILYLGRIDAKKAIENLIKAIDVTSKFRTSNFVLKIAGDYNNEYGLSLLKLVEKLNLLDKIQFIGHVEGIEKQKILAEAHFLIMPSHTENFGIVVAEALCQGTPAIASKGTPWKILEEEKAGFWVKNDTINLSRILDKVLLLDDKEYNNYSLNSRKLVEKNFDIFNNIYKWRNEYEKLLS